MTENAYRVYNPNGMPFRRLGPSGLRVPVMSLGGWLTFGGSLDQEAATDIIGAAFDHGINMFDTAETYSGGNSEMIMGVAFQQLGIRRSDLIISTKLYWGLRAGANDSGLSRKHIIEGTQESLERLQMSYVDIIYANRPDHSVPMEEIVRAFNYVIEHGWAFYWGTSEWSALDIEEAFSVARELRLMPPVVDQCEHNFFCRERPEVEYLPLYEKRKYKTAAWSPLGGGLLTGKYNKGIPLDSRFASLPRYVSTIQGLLVEPGLTKIEILKRLEGLAVYELGCTVGALALAWLLKDPNTSTIILGVSSKAQLMENIAALKIVPNLTAPIMAKIEAILANAPHGQSTMRGALDDFSSV